MSLNELGRENMSATRKLKIACPCGYGFETCNSEDNAIAMVQAHFNKFHADMLPFGITTTEARALLTTINDIGKTRPATHPLYPTDPASTFSLKDTTPQGKTKRKKNQILIH